MSTIPHSFSPAPRIPPYFNNTDHRQRCLEQLRSKTDPLEKYIYMSGLKERDPNLFYEVLLANMLEIIPILYTPTVHLANGPTATCLTSFLILMLGRRCVLAIFAHLAPP